MFSFVWKWVGGHGGGVLGFQLCVGSEFGGRVDAGVQMRYHGALILWFGFGLWRR